MTGAVHRNDSHSLVGSGRVSKPSSGKVTLSDGAAALAWTPLPTYRTWSHTSHDGHLTTSSLSSFITHTVNTSKITETTRAHRITNKPRDYVPIEKQVKLVGRGGGRGGAV
uniref:Uncharacterized protein n=1 Tax=Sexangularia sp. CB-2014 TaxID=1486929 RepID=A0A7S1V9J4_9EUKA